MVRRVYFAFHYKDLLEGRADMVHDCWLKQDSHGFWYPSFWDAAKAVGENAIRALVDFEIVNTSVTVVLVGSRTYGRTWVRHEIAKSLENGNGLLAVHINGIPDRNQQTTANGPNPLDFMSFRVDADAGTVRLWELGQDGHSASPEWITCKGVSPIPVERFRYDLKGKTEGPLSDLFPIYDWSSDNGCADLRRWIEAASGTPVQC